VTNPTFTSVLGPTIRHYLELKHALGKKYAGECAIFKHLDAFLTAANTDLTVEAFIAWCRTREHLSSGVRRRWMQIVRNLCLYRRRTHPACFVPDSTQFPRRHQAVSPYVFTETEIIRLLGAAKQLRRNSRSPLRPENFRLALVVLYTMGLRRGELLRLTVGDYDPSGRTILIRESKFHKSRRLPLSSDAAREVQALLSVRRRKQIPVSADSPLLWNNYRGATPYTGTGLGSTIRELFAATGIRTPAGKSPRVHDFRHSFAVHALVRWYRAGGNVQAKLPLLATYMGHVSVVSTAYYLHFAEEVAAQASDRFAQRCALIISENSASGGDQ